MRTVIYAVVGYLFMIAVVRLLRRRAGAQMTPFEFVIIFLIGGVAILATVGDDHSETNSICAVLTICLLHRWVSWLRVNVRKIALLIDGTPLVALRHGKPEEEVVQGMMLDHMDLMAAARTKGVKKMEDIKYAVLERNGAISVLAKESDESKG